MSAESIKAQIHSIGLDCSDEAIADLRRLLAPFKRAKLYTTPAEGVAILRRMADLERELRTNKENPGWPRYARDLAPHANAVEHALRQERQHRVQADRESMAELGAKKEELFRRLSVRAVPLLDDLKAAGKGESAIAVTIAAGIAADRLSPIHYLQACRVLGRDAKLPEGIQ